ncbi:hypothetical protein GOV12_06905 [Candidatus Pacearchaeota archaeon]|nr:hypothetical protein [Candidatus Pacearchaeota archaeon]
MAKQKRVEKRLVRPITVIVRLAVFLSMILVSLAVGFSMTEGGALNQSIPYVSGFMDGLIVAIAGWIVVILTLVSIVLSIIERI